MRSRPRIPLQNAHALKRWRVLLAAYTSLACSAPSLADAALRAALIEVWPRYQSMLVVKEYANECEPPSANKISEVFAQWVTAQGLSDRMETLLEKTFSANEIRTMRAGVETKGRSKVKAIFPNCITGEQFASLVKSPAGDLQQKHGTAIALIAKAAGGHPPESANTARPQSASANLPAASTGNVASASAAPAAGASTNQSDLEGVYMEQNTGFGVGGMVTFNFDSYAVFKDGVICDNIDTIVRGHSAQTKGCGQWTRKGNGFSVRWNKGKSEELGGSTFYRGHPAASGERLNGRYMAISGGGNTATGGSAMIVAAKVYVFYPDGRFSFEKTGGASAPQVAVSSVRSQQGTYTLDKNVIEMRFPDGKISRSGFFFFPAHGKKTHGSIGIGESVYSFSK